MDELVAVGTRDGEGVMLVTVLLLLDDVGETDVLTLLVLLAEVDVGKLGISTGVDRV